MKCLLCNEQVPDTGTYCLKHRRMVQRAWFIRQKSDIAPHAPERTAYGKAVRQGV